MERRRKSSPSSMPSVSAKRKPVRSRRARITRKLGDEGLDLIADIDRVKSRVATLLQQRSSRRLVDYGTGGSTSSSWTEEERADPRKGYVVTPTPEWKAHVFLHAHPQAVTFETESDLERAFRSFDDPKNPLFMVPFDLVEGLTIVLPLEALQYLREAEIQFKHSEVLSTATLDPKERAKLRP